jgi:cyclophilin family peptidyl-prolyl cis-trans isomerase
MHRLRSLALGVLTLTIATAAGMAWTSSAVTAQTPAAAASGCWNEPASWTNGWMQWATAPNMVIDPAKTYTATITTNRGVVTVDLYASAAPTTVNNFVCLAESGYYDFVLFHRVINGFMIQTGDPTGTGSGGPGYQFADELNNGYGYEIGTLAMANSGPNTNGSQFFIVQGEQGMGLPNQYTIFGKVTTGMDIINGIAQVPVKDNGRGEMSSPIPTIGIVDITITSN